MRDVLRYCPLNDGSLFIMKSSLDGYGTWGDPCFVVTLAGMIEVESGPRVTGKSEMLNHNKFVFLIGQNNKGKIYYFDLQKARWSFMKTPNFSPLNFKLYAEEDQLCVLEFEENQLKRTTIDLITQKIFDTQTFKIDFKNILDYFSISIVNVKKDAIFVIYAKKDGKNGLFYFDFHKKIQSNESDAIDGKLFFSVILKDNFYMLVCNEPNSFCVIKSILTEFLISNLINGNFVEFYDLQTKIPNLDTIDTMSNYTPLFNHKSTIPILNYFKYSNFATLDENHRPVYLFEENGIVEYIFERQNSKRKQLLKNLKLPKLACVENTSEGSCLVIAGSNQNNRVLSITSDVFEIGLFDQSDKLHSRLNLARCAHASLTIKDDVYVLGGYEGTQRSSITDSVERFNKKGNNWLFIENMKVARADFDVCGLFSSIFVFFGDSNEGPTNSIEYYDFESCEWRLLDLRQTSFLPKLKSHKVLKLSYNSVIVFGGEGADQEPNLNFYIIKWTQGFQKIPTLIKLEDRLQRSINRPLAFLSKKDIIIFGNVITVYKSGETPIRSYLETKILPGKPGPFKYLASFCCKKTVSSNRQFESEEFKYLHLLGIEAHPRIYRMNALDFSWEVMRNPKSFNFQDYSCSISMNDGRIFICGGIDGKATQISKTAYILALIEGEFEVRVLPGMLNSRYTFAGVQINNRILVIGGRRLGSVV